MLCLQIWCLPVMGASSWTKNVKRVFEQERSLFWSLVSLVDYNFVELVQCCLMFRCSWRTHCRQLRWIRPQRQSATGCALFRRLWQQRNRTAWQLRWVQRSTTSPWTCWNRVTNWRSGTHRAMHGNWVNLSSQTAGPEVGNITSRSLLMLFYILLCSLSVLRCGLASMSVSADWLRKWIFSVSTITCISYFLPKWRSACDTVVYWTNTGTSLAQDGRHVRILSNPSQTFDALSWECPIWRLTYSALNPSNVKPSARSGAFWGVFFKWFCINVHLHYIVLALL